MNNQEAVTAIESKSELPKWALYLDSDNGEGNIVEITDETEAGSRSSAARIMWNRLPFAWQAEFSAIDLENYIHEIT